MQKREKPKYKPNPVLKTKIAERLKIIDEIPVYAGLMVMQDKDKHVLWTIEAKYGYDYWTVESSKYQGVRISAVNFMDEVFYECPEVDSIECINVSLQTYNLFVWDKKKVGAKLKESGDIVFGRLPKLSSSDGQRKGMDESSSTLAIVKGFEQIVEEVV